MTQNENVSFIISNTESVEFDVLANECIVPSFADNNPTISHSDFIATLMNAARDHGFEISEPEIRVSNVVNGRIPEARNKPLKDLLPEEKTFYYQRMAFQFNVPEITENVHGNDLTLSIGGVRDLKGENLLGSVQKNERLKFFIGFENKVCLNTCVWSDGVVLDRKFKDTKDFYREAIELISGFDYDNGFQIMSDIGDGYLTEEQFAHILGRLKLYNSSPIKDKEGLPEVVLTDSQFSQVADGYFMDKSFKGDGNGITLWNLHGLLTRAVKSSYIDTFLERQVNATDIVRGIGDSLHDRNNNWDWIFN